MINKGYSAMTRIRPTEMLTTMQGSEICVTCCYLVLRNTKNLLVIQIYKANKSLDCRLSGNHLKAICIEAGWSWTKWLAQLNMWDFCIVFNHIIISTPSIMCIHSHAYQSATFWLQFSIPAAFDRKVTKYFHIDEKQWKVLIP